MILSKSKATAQELKAFADMKQHLTALRCGYEISLFLSIEDKKWLRSIGIDE